ncbi:MAG: hypothetical protein LBI33_12265, partial [Propionibacteriaceae bacterium]|nr:hypothetical protein [Propionibacteriaceae bacterium]
IDIEWLSFGAGTPWEIPAATTSRPKPAGPKDITRIVDSIRAAAATAGLPLPRKPWLPDLAPSYDLDELLPLSLKASREEAMTALVLGVMDDPANQAQHPVFWRPDEDGNLAIYGASGSGKSAALRTLAIAACIIAKTARIDVYGFDCGASGLAMLEPLPPVGAIIDGSDQERVGRLLRRLAQTLDERAATFAAARAGSLPDYRRITGDAALPRIVLLIDGFAAFRELYENSSELAFLFSLLARLLAEGRSVGIHVALTAERPNAVSTSLSASIQRRLILRQADENSYTLLNIPKDILGSQSPAGRAVFAEESNEIQVSVFNASPDTERQAASIDKLAKSMVQVGVPPAPGVERLPTFIPAAGVPATVGGLPTLGVAEDTLAPVGFRADGTFMVAGLPGSGRTTALRWLVQSLHRWDPRVPKYFVGPARSILHAAGLWADTATSEADVAALSEDILPLLERPAGDHPGAVLVIESLPEFLGSSAENALVALIRAARRSGHFVIGESETAGWGSAWPLIAEIRNGRRGIVVQPDQADGDGLFRVGFPRVKRADFPLGRGIVVDAGKYRTVQLPMPD